MVRRLGRYKRGESVPGEIEDLKASVAKLRAEVARLEQANFIAGGDLAAALLQNKELLMALGRAHNPSLCPYNQYGKCWACVALKKYGDKMPDQHLAVCSVCKELIEDTFAARKTAWCEKCESYAHGNCRAAHNLNYCKVGTATGAPGRL